MEQNEKTRSPSYVRQLRDFVWRPHQKSGDPSCCWMGSTVIPTPNKNTSQSSYSHDNYRPITYVIRMKKHVLIWYVYVFPEIHHHGIGCSQAQRLAPGTMAPFPISRLDCDMESIFIRQWCASHGPFDPFVYCFIRVKFAYKHKCIMYISLSPSPSRRVQLS